MAHAKNGSGSREILIVFYERRSQFMKSGITFERIQFELIWSLTGSSGLIKKIFRRRVDYRLAFHRNALQNYSNSAICTAFKAAPFNN
jgi:hypothetical protein